MIGVDEQSVTARIERGDLPALLDGADWKLYAGRIEHSRDWDGFCHAIGGIAWVRCQAFWRELGAESEASDWAEHGATHS